MPAFHLAQLNIADLAAPLDSPVLADFVANLDRINAIADQSTGFVWRLQTEDGDSTGFRPFGDSTIVNLSVWEDIETLREYVYKSAHVGLIRRRREWFVPMDQEHTVLWWVPAGHRPSLDEADEKLKYLRKNGPSATAFTIRKSWPAPLMQDEH